jgi:hypothetical protein
MLYEVKANSNVKKKDLIRTKKSITIASFMPKINQVIIHTNFQNLKITQLPFKDQWFSNWVSPKFSKVSPKILKFFKQLIKKQFIAAFIIKAFAAGDLLIVRLMLSVSHCPKLIDYIRSLF